MAVLYRPVAGSLSKGNIVEQIVKTLRPAAVLVAGIAVFVLGTAFALAADATLTSGSSGALAEAGRWLQCLGACGALGAVCIAGWAEVTRSAWVAAAEIAAVTFGGLLLTVGALASAASSGSSSAAAVSAAVGIAVWALLVLSRAARTNLAEQSAARAGAPGAGAADPVAADPAASDAGTPDAAATTSAAARRSDLWLAAAGGLFLLAIGSGFTSAGGTGAGVAGNVLQALGAAGLAWAVFNARTRRLLTAKPVPIVLVGLVLLAGSYLVFAVVAGLSLSWGSSLSTALSIGTAVQLAAMASLGFATWTRVAELYR